MFKDLWPTTIIEDNINTSNYIHDFQQFNIKLLRDLLTTTDFKFDKNSINWSATENLQLLRNIMDNLVDKWMVHTKITEWPLRATTATLSSSWVNVTQPLQWLPPTNNHNSELVVIYVAATGLEGGIQYKDLTNPVVSPINTPHSMPAHPNSIMLMDPRGTAVTLSENQFKYTYEVVISPGTLLIFPAYLNYYVLNNVGGNARVMAMANYEIE